MTNGQASIEPTLTAANVCLIIKASAEAKVHSIKFGSLEISFGAPEARHPEVVYVSPEQHEAMNKAEIQVQAEETQEDRMRRLVLEDPLAYEEALHSGELKPDVFTDNTDE